LQPARRQHVFLPIIKFGYYEPYENRVVSIMAGITPVLEGKSTR